MEFECGTWLGWNDVHATTYETSKVPSSCREGYVFAEYPVSVTGIIYDVAPEKMIRSFILSKTSWISL